MQENLQSHIGFLGHPKPLLSLSFVELWERFSFYGIRPMLVFFMILAVESGGFGLSKEQASGIYALFGGALYLAALPGGYLADKLFGQKLATAVGAFIIAIGNFFLASSYYLGHKFFFLGLFFIVVGTGLFKTCVSLMVGMLYEHNDPRRDSGFTIFYMGINIGAVIAPLVCGLIKDHYGYHLGFALSGAGMLISLLIYYLRTMPLFNEYAKVHKFDRGFEIPSGNKFIPILALIIFAVISIIIISLLWLEIFTIDPIYLARKFVLVIIILSVLYFAYLYLFAGLDHAERKKLIVFIILFIASSFFWSCFEQKPTSFNLFAKDYTDASIFGYHFPVEWFQSINPFTIIICAPLISMFWIKLAKANKEIDSLSKFSLGLIFAAAAFFVMFFAAQSVLAGTQRVSPLYISACFLLLSIGELCLSPVGLSIMSQIAPQKISSSVMGLWFVSLSLGNVVAGITGANVAPQSVAELPFMFTKFGIALIIVAALILLFKKKILKLL